ncbi:hypothetical protein CC86DRAFT_160030 [Ophiobolus disseminans]|uniref:Uncharacterized protein n=1 Tax=Ophiobolus disseminans TaxID=1469910 RepID=A0A6A7AC84_9PLEO|nr:hypothetical protein CC86DRAFT_160030 [Ophiobolus disseminans]
MAPATIEGPAGEQNISAAATILRNVDPLSQALRNGDDLNVDEIAHLSKALSTSQDTLSSVGSPSTIVFSSRTESTVTKPTSADTSQQHSTHQDKGKRRVKSGYASSLSVTYGSASEAEVERRALCKDTLIALGDWADTELEHARPLKGVTRAKPRQQSRRMSKQKKPVIVIEQHDHAHVAGRASGRGGERGPMFTTAPTYGSTDARYLRHRSPKQDDDPVRLAEEGRSLTVTQQLAESKPLSHARVYMLAGLIIMKMLTIVLSAYAAFLTGRTRMSCTKGIVFSSTVLLSTLTVLAMLISKRALSEALLAGLIEFVFGFALVVELDDFM